MNYFKRFKEIDLQYIYTDKHIHSRWTDGENSVLEIAKEAQKIGLKQIAISDHIRIESDYFNEYYKEIKEISDNIGIELLVGFEAKISNLDGDIDVSEDVLKKAQIRIASVHRFPIDGKLFQPDKFDKTLCQELELRLSLSAINKRGFNVLGHPGGMSIITYKEFPLNFFEQIVVACRENDIAFELNANYHQEVLVDLKHLLKKYNVFVSLGSDSHKIEDLGKTINSFKNINSYE